MRVLNLVEARLVSGGAGEAGDPQPNQNEAVFTIGNYTFSTESVNGLACKVMGNAAGYAISEAADAELYAVQLADGVTELLCDKASKTDWSFKDADGNTPIDNLGNFLSEVGASLDQAVGDFFTGIGDAMQAAAGGGGSPPPTYYGPPHDDNSIHSGVHSAATANA